MPGLCSFTPPIRLSTTIIRSLSFTRRNRRTTSYPRKFQPRTTKVRLSSTLSENKENNKKSAVSTAVFNLLLPTKPQLLLIQRGKPPNEGLWALPGGSVNSGEDLIHAAGRELLEETNIPSSAVHVLPNPVYIVNVPIPNSKLVYCIHVFAAVITTPFQPIAGDDARDAAFYDMNSISHLHTVSTLHEAVKIAYNAIKSS